MRFPIVTRGRMENEKRQAYADGMYRVLEALEKSDGKIFFKPVTLNSSEADVHNCIFLGARDGGTGLHITGFDK